MGGGEVLKKGWLIKSPPLESGGMKVRKFYDTMIAMSTPAQVWSIVGAPGIMWAGICCAVPGDSLEDMEFTVFCPLILNARVRMFTLCVFVYLTAAQIVLITLAAMA